jgi:hypothetical protein
MARGVQTFCATFLRAPVRAPVRNYCKNYNIDFRVAAFGRVGAIYFACGECLQVRLIVFRTVSRNVQ